jgi:YD repeat-containing protein
MKVFLLTGSLLLSVTVFSQHTAAEIKKWKISKMKVTTASGESTTITERYFDKQGSDTAVYINGNINTTVKFEYNQDGKVSKAITNKDGQETESSVYNYQPDGSYKISNTDKAFGLTRYEWYDKKGRLIKSQSPDGNTTTYTYNSKGNLVSMQSDGKNSGVKINITVSYNSKGQRSSEVSAGEYKWTREHYYDAKGLLVKTVSTSQFDGEKSTSTSTYSYEFRK